MPTSPRARSWLLLGLAGVMMVAGCRGGGSARNARAVRVPVDAPIAEECPEEVVPEGMERLSTAAEDGTPLGAAVLGTGPTAVVLVHGSGQDLCDWLPFTPRVAELGVTVVPIDLRGRGASGGVKNDFEPYPGDVAAVVDAVRQQGAERVVLVGTSLGASTALISAGRIDPPVDAVVAVSPPLSLGGLDVKDEVGRYAGPIFLLVAEGDKTFARNVETLTSTVPSVAAATVLDGSQHGLRLVQDRPADVVNVIARAVDAAGGP